MLAVYHCKGFGHFRPDALWGLFSAFEVGDGGVDGLAELVVSRGGFEGLGAGGVGEGEEDEGEEEVGGFHGCWGGVC